jgi:hypothetical protein
MAARLLWLGKEGRLTAIGIDQMIKLGGGDVALADLHPPPASPHVLSRPARQRWR